MACVPFRKEGKMELKPGKYRHFKGGEYELIGIAKHSETLEPMVVYRALYGEQGLRSARQKCGPNGWTRKTTTVPDSLISGTDSNPGYRI